MPKPRKNQRITFRLTEDQKKRVERLADRRGKDIGEFVRELVVREIGEAA